MERIELPSLHQINQIVKVYFSTGPHGDLDTDSLPLKGTIIAVHFYPGKVKYDIELFWYNNDGEEKTRIYNVDSFFVA